MGAVRVSGVQRAGVNVQGGGCGGCEGQWGAGMQVRMCRGVGMGAVRVSGVQARKRKCAGRWVWVGAVAMCSSGGS